MPEHPRYIVWCPTGPFPPRVTHADRDEARHAASQMARRNGSQRFYVAEIVDVYEVMDVEHTDLQAERAARTEAEPPVPAPPATTTGKHPDDCPCADCSIPF